MFEFISQLFPGGGDVVKDGIENTSQTAPELLEWDSPCYGQIQGHGSS